MSDARAEVLAVSAADYHADPCPAPSLSSSIAQLIVNESPLHAWTAHPRLNPDHVREYSQPMDKGSICHALLLEGRTDRVHLILATKTEGTGKNKVDTGIPVDDWRTARAQEERDTARAAGKFPILQCDWPEVEAMFDAGQSQLKAARIDLSQGDAEHTIKWQEPNGVWCRARLDWISKDRKDILDYKTTGVTANPDVVTRTLFSNGYDIQEAFYRRGVKAVYGIDARFRFLYQETNAPYAMSVVRIGDNSLGDKKVQYAIDTFGECLQSGVWPGYPMQTAVAVVPAYEEKKWTDRELRSLGITL